MARLKGNLEKPQYDNRLQESLIAIVSIHEYAVKVHFEERNADGWSVTEALWGV